MAYGELLNKVHKLLGLRTLRANFWVDLVDSESSAIKSLKVHSYWTALIQGFQPTISFDETVVAVVTTDKWHKGIILTKALGEEKETNNDFYHSSFELWGWEDPVVPALQSANLFPVNLHIRNTRFQYTFQFGTALTSGEFYGNSGKIDNPNYTNLWKSLLSTVIYFAELSDNAKIYKYIRYEEFKNQLNLSSNQTEE